MATTAENAHLVIDAFVDLLAFEVQRALGQPPEPNPALERIAAVLSDPTAVLAGVSAVARDLVRQVEAAEGLTAVEVLERTRARVSQR